MLESSRLRPLVAPMIVLKSDTETGCYDKELLAIRMDCVHRSFLGVVFLLWLADVQGTKDGQFRVCIERLLVRFACWKLTQFLTNQRFAVESAETIVLSW